MISRSVQLTAILLCIGTIPLHAADPKPVLAPFVAEHFQRYCHRCHGESIQKAERRFDRLPDMLTAGGGGVVLLQDALDAINRGDMPPMKQGVDQPAEQETRRVVELITKYLQEQSNSGQLTTTMRRLNRFEYVNTLRDLLQLPPHYFDSTSDFPPDATVHGFDNNAEALTLSDYQMQRYLEVAEHAIDAASHFGTRQPQPQVWSYTGKDFNGVTSYERAPVTWRLIVDNDYLEIGHGQPSERHPNYVNQFAKDGGVPADGWYDVSVRAAAANRLDHSYEHGEFEKYRRQPLKMALWIAPNVQLLDKNAADQRQLVEVWDLPDDEPDTFTQRVWLSRGSIPFVSWTNGISSKGNIRRVAERYHPEVVRATKTQRDAAQLGDAEARQLVETLLKNEDNKLLSEVYHGPRVRVWSMNIEGPTFEQWPPVSHRVLFGDKTDASRIDLNHTVQRFATRAFRRPVDSAEVAHYVQFIRDRIGSGETPARAITLGLAAILTSPRFLYLDEGNDEQNPQLAPYELASRLSYFLWSSMPDEELLEAAASGRLSDPAELKAHADRMLRDQRADAFVEHFTDSWLRINTLGSMPPDPKAFESYYSDRLEQSFKTETRLYFADLLKTNGSVLSLLDSDHTFLNDALAIHYGIEGVTGEHFRRVLLKPEHRRGGLLGHGSVLTLTANGIETSPVVRGVWVLENLLGTPPPSPPPDVDPLEPDTRGTTSIREQLDKHSTVSACADCHQKIDPAGFALEFFDPIGGFRTRYPAQRGAGLPVDGFGQLPTGETFDDERGLKRLLLDRKSQFVEALTEKLLTYATGRSMTFRDRAEIDAIATECADKGYRLRDLVINIATSEIFRSR